MKPYYDEGGITIYINRCIVGNTMVDYNAWTQKKDSAGIGPGSAVWMFPDLNLGRSQDTGNRQSMSLGDLVGVASIMPGRAMM